MNGLFGGILEIANLIGGGILYVLIGKAAWKDNSVGRGIRLSIGAIPIGFFFGLIAAFIFPFVPAETGNGKVLKESTGITISGALALGGFLSFIIIWVLEGIRSVLEKDN